jgi:hypothetical protein
MDTPRPVAENEPLHKRFIKPENHPARVDTAMKFIVRYWSSLLPAEYRERRGERRWLDYSAHPASKLGLHNAMLAVHDRSEILAAHGCQFECAVFVIEEKSVERLSQETANALFAALPRGDVKWLNIKEFLLPSPPEQRGREAISETTSGGEQLPLFAHIHTPYDDLDQVSVHTIDIDI